jgi:hypothetical protein
MRDFSDGPRFLMTVLETFNRKDAKDAKKPLIFSLRPLRLSGESFSVDTYGVIPTRGVIIHA